MGGNAEPATISFEDDGVKKWARGIARANLWRMPGHIDLDDLVQEAALTFCLCRKKYGSDLDPPQFMALFMRCFRSRVSDIARSRLKESALLPKLLPSASSESPASILGRNAPAAVVNALKVLGDDGMLSRMRRSSRDGRRGRQGFVEQLAEAVGTDADSLERQFREYFR